MVPTAPGWHTSGSSSRSATTTTDFFQERRITNELRAALEALADKADTCVAEVARDYIEAGIGAGAPGSNSTPSTSNWSRSTLSEAQQRASRLRSALERRGVHPDVLHYCSAEFLGDNPFHAVLEATKSVALKSDGTRLVQEALAGRSPMLRINALASESHRSEQRGFATLLVGMFGTFRNPTAHAPRISWPMSEEDALDLFTLASYTHRRLDGAGRHSP